MIQTLETMTTIESLYAGRDQVFQISDRISSETQGPYRFVVDSAVQREGSANDEIRVVECIPGLLGAVGICAEPGNGVT
jgi:hypothetical protein